MCLSQLTTAPIHTDNSWICLIFCTALPGHVNNHFSRSPQESATYNARSEGVQITSGGPNLHLFLYHKQFETVTAHSRWSGAEKTFTKFLMLSVSIFGTQQAHSFDNFKLLCKFGNTVPCSRTNAIEKGQVARSIRKCWNYGERSLINDCMKFYHSSTIHKFGIW